MQITLDDFTFIYQFNTILFILKTTVSTSFLYLSLLKQLERLNHLRALL